MDKKIVTVEEMLAKKRKKKIPVDKMKPKVPEVKIKENFGWKAWFFLNEKKTAIGAVSLLAGGLFAGPVSSVLKIIGIVFTGTGVTHKAQKSLNEKTSGEKINWAEIWGMIINLIKKLLKKG